MKPDGFEKYLYQWNYHNSDLVTLSCTLENKKKENQSSTFYIVKLLTSFKITMFPSAAPFLLSSVVSTAFVQEANINFYNDDNDCQTGLFESCVGLSPGVCCALQQGRLAICMDFATTTLRGVATAFSSQFGNQCAIILAKLDSGVCNCPTGTPVITGGSWQIVSDKREESSCEKTVEPNAFR